MKEFILKENMKCRHASCLIRLPDGNFFAVWFAGSEEAGHDVAIYGACRSKTGWGEPVKLAKICNKAHWNPVLFLTADGELQLFFKVGKRPSSWNTWIMRSKDCGKTWSAPEELVPGDMDGGRGPVKNKPILLSDGSVLAPASTEKKLWRSFTDRYENGVWEKSPLVRVERVMIEESETAEPFGVIQPAVWESEPGMVHMLMRSNGGRIYRSDSTDCGRRWCKAYPTELPNNNSGFDLARFPDGRLILVSNVSGMNHGPRNELIYRLSKDNGNTWTSQRYLEKYASGEFSAPSVVILDNNTFALTYTWDRQNIAFMMTTIE